MDTMRILEIQGFQGVICSWDAATRCDAPVIGQFWFDPVNSPSSHRNCPAMGSRRSVGNWEGNGAEIAKLARTMLR